MFPSRTTLLKKKGDFGTMVSMNKEKLKQFIVPHFWQKFCIMLIGIFFMGFFLSFLLMVNWGTDPYTFQNTIISKRIGWTFGNWQLLLNALLLVLVFIFNKKLIGLGTIANMVLIGYTADFFTWLWRTVIPQEIFTEPSFLWLKILIFVCALLFFVISAAIYMNAQMGLSPYDGMASIFSAWCKKLPFFLTRICYDLFAVVVGVLVSLGTNIPIVSSLIGSLAMSISLGPAIQLVGAFMKKHIVKG